MICKYDILSPTLCTLLSQPFLSPCYTSPHIISGTQLGGPMLSPEELDERRRLKEQDVNNKERLASIQRKVGVILGKSRKGK